MQRLQRWMRCERGQDLLEYALLASLIALVAVGAAGALGNLLNSVFWQAIGPSI